MAYYAHISNEQYTVADRARLEEARGEKDVIETANRASDEYATLKTAYQDSFTSETLEGLQSDLKALYPDIDSEPSQEDVDAINDAIIAEKAALAADKEAALADMKAKEAEGTEALVTEMAALETSIANTPYIVTHVATGVDEIKYVSGDSSAQNEQVRVLEESKKDIEYNPIEDEYPAELQEIDDQIQALIEEIRNIPQVAVDDTLYWEGWYRHQAGVQAVRRMSYNTQGGVHKLGGTPFRKNYAGKGYMYDPVRDAFYTAQPYASWTLNEDTCYWEAPTPSPEGMDWHWNEATLEWIDKPGVKPYASWTYNEENQQWIPPVDYPENYYPETWNWRWNEETLTWEEV
jgi:hypothetical protein